MKDISSKTKNMLYISYANQTLDRSPSEVIKKAHCLISLRIFKLLIESDELMRLVSFCDVGRRRGFGWTTTDYPCQTQQERHDLILLKNNFCHHVSEKGLFKQYTSCQLHFLNK